MQEYKAAQTQSTAIFFHHKEGLAILTAVEGDAFLSEHGGGGLHFPFLMESFSKSKSQEYFCKHFCKYFCKHTKNSNAPQNPTHTWLFIFIELFHAHYL